MLRHPSRRAPSKAQNTRLTQPAGPPPFGRSGIERRNTGTRNKVITLPPPTPTPQTHTTHLSLFLAPRCQPASIIGATPCHMPQVPGSQGNRPPGSEQGLVRAESLEGWIRPHKASVPHLGAQEQRQAPVLASEKISSSHLNDFV